MHYKHIDLNQKKISLPIGKVVCVGRNYADHAKELNNKVPEEPLLFMKPNTALTHFSDPISIQHLSHAVHYELEVAILIGQELKQAQKEHILPAIAGVGLSLDLTLRDVQNQLKSEGYPWEKAKAFDGSCPTSFFCTQKNIDLTNLSLQLSINNKIVQQDNTRNMIFDIVSLIQYTSSHFTLLPGDIVLTGTPAGVGKLNHQDMLSASLHDFISLTTSVC